MLEKVFSYHKKWINTVLKFGCTQQEAEDIVGDMYCIIGKMLNKGLDISFGDDVNYYYIYRTLKTSYLQLYNKKKKEGKVSLDLTLELQEVDSVDFDAAFETLNKELKEIHFYDRKVFNLIQEGCSITELSKRTTISYHSLYNTYRKTKSKLIEKVIFPVL